MKGYVFKFIRVLIQRIHLHRYSILWLSWASLSCLNIVMFASVLCHYLSFYVSIFMFSVLEKVDKLCCSYPSCFCILIALSGKSQSRSMRCEKKSKLKYGMWAFFISQNDGSQMAIRYSLIVNKIMYLIAYC